MAGHEAPVRRRTGEKLGWIGGWLGGFLWVVILSVARLLQGRAVVGLIGFGLFLVAVAVTFSLGPWRHPSVRLWKPMLPVYLAFFTSIAWALWAWDNLEPSGLSWWSFFWILPCLIPLWTDDGRRWDDGREDDAER